MPCGPSTNLHNCPSAQPFWVVPGTRLIRLGFENMRQNRAANKRRKAKAKARTARKDPLWVDGQRPRPMYVDYKDIELLKKLINRHGRIVGRRKTGCSAVSQHAVTSAVKRARFMALLPFKGS